jgi:hypothetical protein
MATSPQQNPQQNPQPGNQSGGERGAEQRSESLLPAGQDDADDDDGRFGVAEEVNLDQQSDLLRRVGKPPKDLPKP